MNKSLELFAAPASTPPATLNTSVMAIEVHMPCQIHALVINCQQDALPALERNLSGGRNLSWDSIDSLSSQQSAKSGLVSYQLLLLVLPNDEQRAAQALQHAASYGAAIILLGHDTPQRILRLAFQQGVCDFISLDAPAVELLEAIKCVAVEIEKNAALAPVVAVINGKGGSGASFIATALADIVAAREKGEVALIDCDLYSGTLAHMLGLKPSYFITDALREVEQLDAVALNSTMTKKNQLHLLAAQPFSLLNSDSEIQPQQFKQLLWKCRKHYNQIIIDMSRGPEQWNLSALEDAEILLVLQQNVISIRETKALIEQLTVNLGIAQERIHLLVNRYHKSSSEISLSDITQATGIESVWVVANDFKVASQCTDLNAAITNIARRRRILTDFKKITTRFSPQPQELGNASPSIWSRLFGG